MDNLEKAMNGYAFIRGDATLAAKRDRARDLCFELNQTRPSDHNTRQSILHEIFPHINTPYTILSPFLCDYGEFIRLGSNVFLNYNCTILDGGIVTFGDGVLVGPNCTFATVSHALDPTQRAQGIEIFLPITIGNNVWLGANVTVLAGVTIGDNSVIASGSVVTRDIPANSFATGVPCKVKRQLNEQDKQKYPFAPE